MHNGTIAKSKTPSSRRGNAKRREVSRNTKYQGKIKIEMNELKTELHEQLRAFATDAHATSGNISKCLRRFGRNSVRSQPTRTPQTEKNSHSFFFFKKKKKTSLNVSCPNASITTPETTSLSSS